MRVKRIRLLTEENIKKDPIETIKYSGLQCYTSDLARLQGVPYDYSNGFGEYWYDGKTTLTKKARTNISYLNYIDKTGKSGSTFKDTYSTGVRIAFSFDDIEDLNIEELENLTLEYPQTIIGGMLSELLDKVFYKHSNLLVATGRTHNINGVDYPEYEVYGMRFIKKGNNPKGKVLSDGTISETGKDVYLRVEQIPLIIDENAKMVYSSNILFSSPFDKDGHEFKQSYLKDYLNTSFLMSINDEYPHKETRLAFSNEDSKKNNRYNFNYENITEEDIIEICINCNVAVFVHGKTGVGKTERLVALDNDLEIVDFGCTSSDGFTGIIAKDYNSKELFLYEPYWYKSLCEKCMREPDKIHILFLEELTNAKSDVQKVAFEVTLNKTLTNSGFRLELPKNAVVVAAGNESNESKSANALSEPLFGRFAHVYIDTDSESWLKWALKRKKEGKELIYHEHKTDDRIHPAIIDYIRVNGDKVLRTPYNGDTPNADPRKWALASKALYESNNPNVLRAFIGEELTKDFIKFTQLDLITVEDVINDNYNFEDIPFDPSIRWYTTLCLSSVGDDYVDKVREFVSRLGKEFLAYFDYEWSKDNEERIMKIYSTSNNGKIRSLGQNGTK